MGFWNISSNEKGKLEHHLYHNISKHLLANPTEPEDPLVLRIQGLPPFKDPLPPPAKPRGWKINDIVPTHSAAVTGGGVHEDLFKDFQNMMQQPGGAGGGPAGLPPAALAALGGGPTDGDSGAIGGGQAKKEKKKEKKKKK
jgi:signal recognition particle subunit SRP19